MFLNVCLKIAILRKFRLVLRAFLPISGIQAVKIRELVVPELVEVGSKDILLDCDFDYTDSEKHQGSIQ
jgi:hypothetical protein